MSDSAHRDDPHAVEWTATALRDLQRLPPKVADAIVAFCYGTLAEAPRRVGRPLARELTGLWSARRATYRIIYAIEDDVRVIDIHAVGHRRHIYGRR